jgi:protein disulfide-isomerase A1
MLSKVLFMMALAGLVAGHPGHDHDHDHDHDHGHEHEHEHGEEPQSDVPSDVVVLTDADYQQTIASQPVVLVEFYAPWCGHCKSLAPEYEKAATELKGKAMVAKVDATANEQTAQAEGIQGFPTIKLFVAGKPFDYRGGRTSQALVSFVTKAMEPAVEVLKTSDQVKAFIESHTVAVLGYFASGYETPSEPAVDGVFSYASFLEAATAGKLTSSASFGVVPSGADIGAVEGASAVAVLYREGSVMGAYDAATHRNASAVLQWAAVYALPAFDEIGPSNFQGYLATGLPLLWLALNPADDNEAVKTVFATLAPEFRGKLLFVWLDNSKYGGQSRHIGLSGKVIPAFSIVAERAKFPYDEQAPLEVEPVRAFLASFVAGTLEPFIKSAEVPEDNAQRNVFEVTGKTFKSAVIDPADKDVLVEFFAEYCGHCKALAPTYEELGRIFKSVPSVVVARINIPENDVPVSIQGFPTIILFPAGDKDHPVTFEAADRTLPALISFLQRNAKSGFEIPAEAAEKLKEAEQEQEQEEEEKEEGKEEL